MSEEVIKVVLFNNGSRSLYITGSKGTDWIAGSESKQIDYYQTELVGSLRWTGSNWGWLYVGYAPDKPAFQIYIAASSVRVYDYCVQWYDGGNNESGVTIPQTKVDLQDSPGGPGILVQMLLDFDPWMARLVNARPDLTLNQVTIPGAHDCGTKGLSSGSECQDTTIEDQLMMGIRYFDIRVNADTPRLEIVHGDVAGSGNTGTYFDDMSTVFSDFLLGSRGLPTTGEIIVAQIKADKGSETGLHSKVVDILRTAFASHLQVVYFDPIRRLVTDPNNTSHFEAIPAISTLRGRLVVIRRYELDQGADPNALGSCTPVKYFASGTDYNTWSQSGGNTSWKDYFSGRQFEWPDKGDNKSYFGGQLIDYRNINGLSFVIQDRYKGNPEYVDKYDLVEQYLDAANAGSSPDSWFLNFASCVYPGGGSEDINPRLQSYFASHTRNHGFGTILMDYVRPELVKSLIAANF